MLEITQYGRDWYYRAKQYVCTNPLPADATFGQRSKHQRKFEITFGPWIACDYNTYMHFMGYPCFEVKQEIVEYEK